jgi:capsule polysaccharide modification protein KpsS
LWNNGLEKCSSDRINSFNIKLKDWRKTGDHIVVVPPSKYMADYFDMHSWLRDIVDDIKNYTDRKIVVSIKNESPLERVLPNAWALVTDHSNAGIASLIEGIPTIFTNPSRKLGSIEEIENPPMDRSFFKGLAYQQWTLEEIRSGEAWDYLEDTKR